MFLEWFEQVCALGFASARPTRAPERGRRPLVPEVGAEGADAGSNGPATELLLRFARAGHEAGYPDADLEERLLALAHVVGHGNAQISSMPTMVELSLGEMAHQRTYSLRVRPRTVDLDAIARLDDLVQDVLGGRLDISAAHEALVAIQAHPLERRWLLLLTGYAAAGAALTPVLGGGWREAAACGLVGLVVGAIALPGQRTARLAPMVAPIAALTAAFSAAVSRRCSRPAASDGDGPTPHDPRRSRSNSSPRASAAPPSTRLATRTTTSQPLFGPCAPLSVTGSSVNQVVDTATIATETAIHATRCVDKCSTARRVASPGNGPRSWVEGRQFLPRIFADVEAARSSVHILMFGWREGGVGIEMADLLERKLAAGVEVRVIVDRRGAVRSRRASRELALGQAPYFL
jgi:uncharacterized membrane protein YjjP (DUF1212 family)